MNAPLLSVRDLVVEYGEPGGLFARKRMRALDGIGFEVGAGETLGLVGESGCGKSTLARALVGLVPVVRGVVEFEGVDRIGACGAARDRACRGMQLVFQDAQASLDPRQRVGDAVAEGIDIHGLAHGRERAERVAKLLEQVGLPAAAADRWPHEFSGGQRQRIGLARALAVEPKLLLLDEPVAALDRSVQAQVVNLLLDLRERRRMSTLFISHDVALVAAVSDRLAVMHLGQIVEIGPTDALLARPRHPFTQALFAAAEWPASGERAALGIALRGEPPSPFARPTGCAFHPRCPVARVECRRDPPPEREAGADHRYRCVE